MKSEKCKWKLWYAKHENTKCKCKIQNVYVSVIAVAIVGLVSTGLAETRVSRPLGQLVSRPLLEKKRKKKRLISSPTAHWQEKYPTWVRAGRGTEGKDGSGFKKEKKEKRSGWGDGDGDGDGPAQSRVVINTG